MTKRALELISLLASEIVAEKENRLLEAKSELRRATLEAALRLTHGKPHLAAKVAGISHTSMYYFLQLLPSRRRHVA